MTTTLKRNWQRSGVNLALFAMLALWISPALAWVCCCHASVAPVQKTCHMAGPSPHACCEKPAKTARLSAPDDCHCDKALSAVPVNLSPADSFSFAPVAVTVSKIEFQLGSSRGDSKIAYTAWEARPRGPDPFSRGGRAPPVFSA